MHHTGACKIIIRSRRACTAWEKLCKAVVGNPVHMDVVLAKAGSSSVRFCFSAYVGQKFEMYIMDEEQIMDPCYVNHCMDITDEEYDRCMKFMLELVDRGTKYDYVDALVLMPLAPKGSNSSVRFSKFMSPVLEDVAEKPRKVFCSQSVVLMLRECLDEENGTHAMLVERLKKLNSRLVSPKMVFDILEDHPFAHVITNSELMQMIRARQEE